MSIITTYPGITDVAAGDLLIISDISMDGNPTRTVSVGQLSSTLSPPAGFTLTTLGTSGEATLLGNVLNIPNYSDEIGSIISVDTTNGTYINLTPTTPSIGAIVITADLSATGLGSPSSNYFLRGDNTWAIPTSGGISSVGLSTDISAFTIANSPLNQNGVLGLNKVGGSEGQFLRQDGVWADVPGAGGISQIIGEFPIEAATVSGITTLSLDSGWDILPYDGGNSSWSVQKYNGYMEAPSGVSIPNIVNIRPTGLDKANEGYFIFVATSASVPEDFLNFTSVNGGNTNAVKTTWSATGTRTYVPSSPLNGFWRAGTAVKFHYIFKDNVIWWSACCEIATQTTACAILEGQSIVTNIMDENTIATPTSFSGGLPAGDGGSGLPMTWSITTQPQHGTIVLNTTTGTYVYTPTQNYDGNDSFQWEANNGVCASSIGTVNFIIQNVTDISSPPTLYFESNGFGNACGIVQTPDPTLAPPVGYSGVLWEGYYCDFDSTPAQVTIGITYSTDGGTTFLPLLGSAFTFAKDSLGGVPTDNRFTLSTTNFPAGTIKFKLTIQDQTPNVGVERIVTFSAVYDFLVKTEFQMEYFGGTTTGAAQFPTADWSSPSGGPFYDTLWNGAYIQDETTNTYIGAVNGGASALSITPSGGTLIAKYPNVRFDLINVSGTLLPNVITNPSFGLRVTDGTLTTTSNNIVAGDTIEFNAATLDTSFGNSGSTGTLSYTIRVEDILRAPLATGPVSISKGHQTTGHGCNDGGFMLIAWGYDSSGLYRSFVLTRYSSSNNGNDIPYTFSNQATSVARFYSNKNYEVPYTFVSGDADPNVGWIPGAGASWWMRGSNGGEWPLLNSQVDSTAAGTQWDLKNLIVNAPNDPVSSSIASPYFYTTPALLNYAKTNSSSMTFNRVSGIYRMDATMAQTLASTFSSGLINFMVVGASYNRNINYRPSGDWIATTHADACQLRIFAENAGGTNQYEIRNYGGAPPSASNVGTPFLAADGTYVEIDIYQPAGSNAIVRDFT